MSFSVIHRVAAVRIRALRRRRRGAVNNSIRIDRDDKPTKIQDKNTKCRTNIDPEFDFQSSDEFFLVFSIFYSVLIHFGFLTTKIFFIHIQFSLLCFLKASN